VAVPAGRGQGSGDAGDPAQRHPAFRAKGLEQPARRAQQLQYSAPTETGEVEQRSVGSAQDTLSQEQLKGASRNGPCPCGSGKKFKMCHGKA
jgi:preprotein translocase subunit SecA